MMRAFAGARRGRPKNAAANDNDCGDNDGGTPELQMQRALVTRGLEPAASAHPLDLLLAKGWIEGSEQAAGLRDAALYRRLHGRVTVSYGRFYDGMIGGGEAARIDDEDDLARAERRFRDAKATLIAAGARVQRVTEGVAVFSCWLGWLFAKGGAQHGDCRHLREGLATLRQSFAERSSMRDGAA